MTHKNHVGLVAAVDNAARLPYDLLTRVQNDQITVLAERETVSCLTGRFRIE